MVGWLQSAKPKVRWLLKKTQTLEKLFALPTIERMQSVFGEAMNPPLQRYAPCLENLNDTDIRQQLKLLGEEGLGTQVNKDLCVQARDFKEDLLAMLMDEFGADHDVIKALLL